MTHKLVIELVFSVKCERGNSPNHSREPPIVFHSLHKFLFSKN